ncbi:hypothetical protein Acr_08g0012860 [Actinidia rufa]|uniref:Uncharacterized protein n=1 Tax=Actinidia rufa TaxID=165716 RepID=A0A7J0F2J6_9ERIC|nr:hypothetical protein Acr_08g0012860 [Actinidia rufa]
MRLITSNLDKDLFLDEFRPGDNGLWSFPRHNGSLPNSSKSVLTIARRLFEPPTTSPPTNYWSISRGGCGSTGADPGLPRGSVPGKCKGKEPFVDMPKRPRREMTLVGALKLWKLEFYACDLGRHVTEADSAQDIDTSLALAWAVMLLSDSIALAKESWDAMRNLLVCSMFRAFKGQWQPHTEWQSRFGPRRASLGCQLCDYDPSSREDYYCRVYSRRALGSSMWPCVRAARAAFALDFPKPLVPYSPLIFSSFDEEEFLNRPNEDEGALELVSDPVVALGIETTNPIEEVGRTIAEAFEERPAEESGVGGVEDVDPPS